MSSNVFSLRLKQARLSLGLSQRNVGIEAGIDEFAASARMNRYEQGVHEPDSDTAKRIAAALHVPLAFFFAEDDDLAKVIRLFSALRKRDKAHVIELMQKYADSGKSRPE